MTSAALLYTLDAHAADVNSVSFGGDGCLATASADKTTRLWRVRPSGGDPAETCGSPLVAHTYAVTSCDVSPDGRQVASCSIDGRCLVWSVCSGRIIAALQHLSGASLRICRFSPDASCLVTGGNDETLCLWDVGTAKLLRSMAGHDAAVVAVTFSPDGIYIVSGSPSGDLRIWDAKYGHGKNLAFEPDAHDLGVTCCAFSPKVTVVGLRLTESDLYLLASGGFDNNVKLWHLISDSASAIKLRRWRTLAGHSAPVMTCCFSPSGHLLASGGADKTVRLWNPLNEHLEHIIEGHTRYVTCCAFSRDGHLLATGSSDRLVKVWAVSSGESQLGAVASIDIADDHEAMSRWSAEEVTTWLSELGLSCYADAFRQNAIDGAELASLTHQSLQQSLNIDMLGHRNKILRAISDLHNRSLAGGQHENGTIVPDEFVCPITREIMRDPVIASDGYTYERAAIEAWMRRGNVRSPMTNAMLDSAVVLPNRNIKMLILRRLQYP